MLILRQTKMLKKGEKILCGYCYNVVYILKEDLPLRAELLSKYFMYEDGKDVPYRASMICPHCNKKFIDINTVYKVTASLVNCESWGEEPPNTIQYILEENDYRQ